MKILFTIFAVAGTLFLVNSCSSNKDWRTASRESAGIAPDPKEVEEAVVHVYGARTWGWRGWFAIHTWVAAKRTGEDTYKVYDVVGWRGRRGMPVMRVTEDIPDRYWYGEEPELIQSHMGEHVDALIDSIEQAAENYPWKTEYKAFPGPNSNTFVAWIGQEVPELELDLPMRAIGKGYLK